MRVKLEDVCLKGSSNLKQSDVIDKNGEYEIYGASGLIGKVDFFHQEKPYIAVVKDGAGIGRTMLLPEKSSVIGTMQYILPNEKVTPKYLYYVIRYMHLEKYFTGATIPHIYFKDYRKEEFNLCDLLEQEKIVSTLSKIETLITHFRTQLEKLDLLVKARFVEMFGDVKLNSKGFDTIQLCKIANVSSSKRVFVEELQSYGIPFYRGTEVGALAEEKNIIPELFITEKHYNSLKSATGVPEIGDLLMPSICSDGRIWLVDTKEKFYFKDGRVLWIHPISNGINSIYLLYFLKQKIAVDYNSIASGTTFAELKIFSLKNLNLFMPPIKVQTQFADFVKKVDKSKFIAF